MNITVRNMEIDPNSNIPQLMFGLFQGGTVRQYISAAKYMIILKPPVVRCAQFPQAHADGTQGHTVRDGSHVRQGMNRLHREGVA